MTISELLQNSTTSLAWTAGSLTVLTLIAFLANWGAKFRLVGASIFAILLAGSSLAFSASYTPPLLIEGAKYAPVVYDNGKDLVVAQVPIDFPDKAIEPTLMQLAGNLKGGGRNGKIVNVRIRKIEPVSLGISRPVILGEVVRDLNQNIITPLPRNSNED